MFDVCFSCCARRTGQSEVSPCLPIFPVYKSPIETHTLTCKCFLLKSNFLCCLISYLTLTSAQNCSLILIYYNNKKKRKRERERVSQKLEHCKCALAYCGSKKNPLLSGATELLPNVCASSKWNTVMTYFCRTTQKSAPPSFP